MFKCCFSTFFKAVLHPQTCVISTIKWDSQHLLNKRSWLSNVLSTDLCKWERHHLISLSYTVKWGQYRAWLSQREKTLQHQQAEEDKTQSRLVNKQYWYWSINICFDLLGYQSLGLTWDISNYSFSLFLEFIQILSFHGLFLSDCSQVHLQSSHSTLKSYYSLQVMIHVSIAWFSAFHHPLWLAKLL